MAGCEVLLTFDVEFSTRVHRAGVGAERHLDWFIFGRCARGDFGLAYHLRSLAARGLKAVFFVDALAGAVMGRAALAHVVEPILAAGQEVQLHIHPEWLDDFARNPVGGVCGQYLWQFTAHAQHTLIELGCAELAAVGAPRPEAFRAGNFGADGSTLAALEASGIRYDSSFDGGIHGAASRIDLPRDRIDPAQLGAAIELPVTVIADPVGGYRHAQLCALSAWEMRAALRHALRQGQRLFTVLMHSFELLARARAQPNGLVLGRFEALLDYLARHHEMLPTRHIADLDAAALLVPSGARPLAANPLRRAHRLVAQAFGHYRYERFGPALTLPRFDYIRPPSAADTPGLHLHPPLPAQ